MIRDKIHDPRTTMVTNNITLEEMTTWTGLPLNYNTLDGFLEESFQKGPPPGYTHHTKLYRIQLGLYDSSKRYYIGDFDLNHTDKTLKCTRLTHYAVPLI